jgi:DNA-directed RNA polymerase specialized sigma subunit
MNNINLDKEQLKLIMADYKYDDDIMNEDDERVRKIKYALSQLPDADRIIFCLQTDIQSQRKVGNLLGVSHTAIGKECKRIKERIIEIINDMS